MQTCISGLFKMQVCCSVYDSEPADVAYLIYGHSVLLRHAEESAHQIPLPGLPATCVAHLDSKHIVCGGWDGVLHLLQAQGTSWVASSVVGNTLQGTSCQGSCDARRVLVLLWFMLMS